MKIKKFINKSRSLSGKALSQLILENENSSSESLIEFILTKNTFAVNKYFRSEDDSHNRMDFEIKDSSLFPYKMCGWLDAFLSDFEEINEAVRNQVRKRRKTKQ